jgi:SAM-dependent methyltransferase
MKVRSLSPHDQAVSPGTGAKVLELSNVAEGLDFTNFYVLDFGCGNGRYLEVFASCIPKVNLYGAEVDADRVTQVKGKGFACFQLDSERSCLPLADESFNVVFSSNVVEHIPRFLYLGYLVEIYRILKPGGRFVVGTPNYPIKRVYDIWKAVKTEFTHYYLYDDPTHCNKMSIYRLEKDLSRLFREVHLEPSYIFFEEKMALLRNERIRNRLRMLADKVSGYCIK